uniref:ABC transmembrane type-1 domain-containing protein n=1 Tax=Panagrolaimus sp. JU765 TaxID=591449 RepID=A0AC34Q781_9BILA
MTVCGIFIFIQYSISKAVKKRAQQDTSLEESEARLSCEFIANVKTIQSLTQETKICRRFEETSKEPYKHAVVRGWLMSCILAIGSGFVSLNFSASYLAGLLMIKLGFCSPFTVFQVIESLNIATMMVMATVSFFPEYSRAKVSAALIFQMLAEESEIDNFSEAGIKPEIQGNVQLSDVDFSYPNSRQILTLKKMSIRANFGQTIAI